MGVPQNGWFIMENPIKMGWFGGKTHHFWKHPVGGILIVWFGLPPVRQKIILEGSFSWFHAIQKMWFPFPYASSCQAHLYVSESLRFKSLKFLWFKIIFKKIQFASIQHRENQIYFFPRVFPHPPQKKKNVSHHIISPVESSHPRVKPWLFASNLQGLALCLSKAWLKKHLKQTIGDIILDCYIFQQKKRVVLTLKKSKFLNRRNFWV